MKPTRKFLSCLLFSVLVSSCSAVKRTTATQIAVRERVEFIPVYTSISIPEIRQEVRVPDTASHLENRFAKSDATVSSRGELTHTLETIPQDYQVKIETKVVYHDSIQIQEVQVPAKLNSFQKFQMDGFWVLLSILFIFILIKFIVK